MKFSIYQLKKKEEVHYNRKAIRSVIYQQTTLVPPLKHDGKLSIELYETLNLRVIRLKQRKKTKQERVKSFMIKYKHC